MEWHLERMREELVGGAGVGRRDSRSGRVLSEIEILGNWTVWLRIVYWRSGLRGRRF